VINHPTPNFDILPTCDREATIMRPDPSAECINVQSEVGITVIEQYGNGLFYPRVE